MTSGLRPIASAIAAAFLITGCGAGSTSAGLASSQLPQMQPQLQSNASPAIERLLASIGGTPAVGTPGRYQLKIVAQSSNGVVLTGRFPTPVTLTDSDTSGATHLSRSSVSNSNAEVWLVYNGLGGSVLGGFHGATITTTSGSISGQASFLTAAFGCVTLRGVGGYYPCDLRDAYSLPSTSAGAGQMVGIVDAYNDPKAEEDLAVYRSEFGLPPCTTQNGCFKKVNQTGQSGNPPSPDRTGWSVEESLDLDMVSAICPNCHILLVETDTNSNADLGQGVDEAAALGATQISNSYGGREAVGENLNDKYYNHPRASVVVSSGDGDFGVTYPASSPYVTAVGGTTLSEGANGRGWNETVWNNENIQGAGSGCSQYEPKPSWQLDPGCTKRMVADVAAVADPFTGVAVYDSFIVSYITLGGWEVEGGTSAAAPIVASIYALAASRSPLDAASHAYSHTSSLNDIVDGNNGGCGTFHLYFCNAGVGYDGPTGNGTPNGVGAFGGPPIRSSQSSQRTGPRRHIPEIPIGSRAVRACTNAQPNRYACDALIIVR
jgi:subtilase family serine protease